MISSIEDLPTDENKNSLNVSYLRSVNIIFGNYAFPDILNNFLIKIKNNLDPNLQNHTNIKGGMTDWKFFTKDPNFVNFINFLIKKYYLTHPELFKPILTKETIYEAWGNEIKKGDSLNYHTHPCYHGILYLTEGCDLIVPELNIKISPKPGDYYIFPPLISHGFEKAKEDGVRYSLVFNVEHKGGFDSPIK